MTEEKKYRILIVEDNSGTQLLFKIAIEKAGYLALVASNYQDAIGIIRNEPIDVAVIDVRLDEEDDKNADGLRILAQISKLESKPHAILATGLWGKYPGLEEYAYAVWEKGQDLDSLVSKVKEALEEKEKISTDKIKQTLHMILAEMARKQLELQDVCELILFEMKTLINAEEANLSLVQDNILVVYASTSGEIGSKLDVEDSISGWAVRRLAAVYIPDINSSPQAKRLYKQGLGANMQSELAVPLKIGVEPIGVLNFESSKRNAFNESEIRLIEELTGQVAIAINSARLQNQTNTVKRLAVILSEINSIIPKGETEVAGTVVDKMLEFMNCDKAAMFRYDKNHFQLDFIAQRGLGDEYILSSDLGEESPRAYIIKTKQELIVTDIELDERFISVRDNVVKEGIRSLIELPLLIRDQLIGSITAYYKEKHQFEPEEKALAKMFADHAAVAFTNAQQYQELEEARERIKLATVGEFAGDIVHRMNSPLAAIKNNVELILMDYSEKLKGNGELYEMIIDIHKISQDAIGMIQEMKINARREMQFENIDIRAVVQSALSDLEMNWPKNVILKDSVTQHSSVLLVRANQSVVKVFKNLITNALEAMPKGGTLTLDIGLDNTWVVISIQDTGIGIPKEWRDEIFSILSVFSKTKADGGGHGLGLWYSRAYIEACGGSLLISESIVGEGTKFVVRLPLQSGIIHSNRKE